jgi:SAM-dependent methyltransferase
MQSKVIRIDLGAGRVKRPGYLSLDRIPGPGVDVVCDAEQRLPFLDNTVDELFSRHLFEHIKNLIPLFEEVFRICKPGARVVINVPYYTSIKAYKDPTHVNFFTEKTFEYFEGKSWENFDFPFRGSFRVKKIEYLYRRPFHKWIPFMSFWRSILWNTVTSMIAELEVVKEGMRDEG